MIVFLAAFFYFNSFILIPKLMLKGKILFFILSILACTGLIVLINVLAAYMFHTFFGHHHFHFFPQMIFGPIFFSIVAVGLSTSFKITSEWFRNEKIKKEMETEKLTSELAFLKSQVNPHFLFNTLNNICSLARKKSDDTEDAIIKLSHIMRYMLYESKDEKVSLEKEIAYLHNYIELQQMRISEKANVRFTIEGSPEPVMIEPMLLIPFVENAFKHGISYIEESAVDISLKISSMELSFTVENTRPRVRVNDVPAESGIGLKNVSRRLELLYPGKHELKVREDELKYFVNLTIRFEG